MIRALSLLACASASAALPASTPLQQEIAGARARASTPRLALSPLSALPLGLQRYLATIAAMNATQDCRAYALAYEYALLLQPARAPHADVWDALRLGPDCGLPPPPSAASLGVAAPWPPAAAPPRSAAGPSFFVSVTSDDGADGSEAAPFRTLARGVSATRGARPPGGGAAAITLRAGVHTLAATITLDARDSGLTIAAFPGEAAWVSGGAVLRDLPWVALNTSGGANVYSAAIASPPAFMTGLLTVAPDGSPAKRLYRAQWPNFNPEWHATAACGGRRAAEVPECARLAAASPLLARGKAPRVREWIAPWSAGAYFPPPQTFFRNLSGLGLKNDSQMSNYNLFSTGRGGACGLWTDAWPATHSYGWDYHCGSVSDGGWEEVDELMHSAGQLNLPVGLTFDVEQQPNMAAWRLNVDPAQRVNGAAVLNSWHTQGWATHQFYITGGVTPINASVSSLSMLDDSGLYPAGGWQGGRTWQTSGSFANPETAGGALLDGGWWVENVAQELDSWDEYYFDPETSTLTVFWNASASAGGAPGAPPSASDVLMAPQLEVFFNITGASDITLSGLGFRDQRGTMLEPWVVPSGGDWALRPFGAVSLFDTERVTIADALFLRTDANAVFLGGRNRNASVLDSEFAWLGMSAVASLGWTQQDDGTGGEQPWGTLLSGLVVREMGLKEKQSSAYFSGRTPLARVENSIFYNGPRALINYNGGWTVWVGWGGVGVGGSCAG